MKLLRTFWRWITFQTYRERLRADFTRQFPGKCYVCSEYAFMIRECYLHRKEVPYHEPCPENYARWN